MCHCVSQRRRLSNNVFYCIWKLAHSSANKGTLMFTPPMRLHSMSVSHHTAAQWRQKVVPSRSGSFKRCFLYLQSLSGVIIWLVGNLVLSESALVSFERVTVRSYLSGAWWTLLCAGDLWAEPLQRKRTSSQTHVGLIVEQMSAATVEWEDGMLTFLATNWCGSSFPAHVSSYFLFFVFLRYLDQIMV